MRVLSSSTEKLKFVQRYIANKCMDTEKGTFSAKKSAFHGRKGGFRAEKSPFRIQYLLLESDLGVFRSPVPILPVVEGG
jgi:hypothetical protein